MNNNTLLLKLGIDPNNFKNTIVDPIKTDDGFIYELQEKKDNRICPYCNSSKCYIKEYYFTNIKISNDTNIKEILRIKRVRFKCKECHKTFTNKIQGIKPNNHISDFIKNQIINDFTSKHTFQEIADKYHISSAMVIKLFDDNFSYIPTGPLPEILCIDEIYFSRKAEYKYVCVLVDYKTRTIYDIIQSRQLPYLIEYFSRFSQNQLDKVTFFISDMYDSYAYIKRRFFKNATHVIDLFHVISQMTNAVNILRTRTMNRFADKGSKEYNFMKTHWKLFLSKFNKIPDKFYTHKASQVMFHYDEMITHCIKLNSDLWTAYNCLQDLYKYLRFYSYSETDKFISWIAKKLIDSNNDDLAKVGHTYNKWKPGICSSFAKNQNNFYYTNAIAESMNNQLATILKSAYGYRNFDRFRKRALLILKYNKFHF